MTSLSQCVQWRHSIKGSAGERQLHGLKQDVAEDLNERHEGREGRQQDVEAAQGEGHGPGQKEDQQQPEQRPEDSCTQGTSRVSAERS
ncbi:hypothetical protein C0Q70_19653 [Pomacea canaliculata]|uniref:Uncharacterized protein n=1 Tax=Pomacea canaliculata TaxID=400727 RepID=A0A2T7NJX8_POMCA|nr:hypothetical protein C0Q70_19653 [Pomacea canaliculata]